MVKGIVFFAGFSDNELKTTLEAEGYKVATDLKRATSVIFGDDPERRQYRLPPRTPFGVTKESIVKNIQKKESASWN